MNHHLWNNDMLTVIVLASNAGKTETYAAEELSAYISKMSGKPVVISDRLHEEKVNIVVGKSACEAAGFLPDNDLTDDGFMIESRENLIFITGIHPRGTLYGVYEFLEEYLGCRFFSPEVEVVPTRNEMVIEPVKLKRIPMIEYRSTSVYQLRDPVYAAKRKINGQAMELDEKFGGRVQYGRPYFVHTFCRNLLKPEDYFDEHPEYFAEVGGERIREKTQLCLTNPDARKCVMRIGKRDISSTR